MNIFFSIILVLAAFFWPGVKVGTVPLSFEYILAGIYFFLARPSVPENYMKMFAVAVIYLAVIAGKNAAGDDGDSRDFLYSVLFFGQLVVFASFRNLFDKGYDRLIIRLVIVCATVNFGLMLLQALNPADIDERLADFWQIPLSLLARGEGDFWHVEEIQARPYGFLAGFNVASLALYLSFRAAYVYTRHPGYRILALLSVLLASARMLALFFVLYELVLPLFIRTQERRRNLVFSVVGVCGCLGFFGLLSALNPDYFFAKYFSDSSGSSELLDNYSTSNRLETLDWAMQNWDKFLTFGGISSSEFLNFSRAVDSEIILRSMQFGLFGFILMVLIIYRYFHQYRSYDTFFLLAVMLWTSITFVAASSFIFLPFLMIYGFACRADYLRRRGTAAEPQRAPGKPGLAKPRYVLSWK